MNKRNEGLPSGMNMRGKAYYANFRCRGQLYRQVLSKDFDEACERLAILKMELAGQKSILDGWTHWHHVRDELVRFAEHIGSGGESMADFIDTFEEYLRLAAYEDRVQ